MVNGKIVVSFTRLEWMMVYYLMTREIEKTLDILRAISGRRTVTATRVLNRKLAHLSTMRDSAVEALS